MRPDNDLLRATKPSPVAWMAGLIILGLYAAAAFFACYAGVAW